ncbi:hypothetical protein C7W88_14175 [Novosphingobium sp. THN1]|jgi:hypothetical protein|uniref:hypothetical protein n=1 Tax=unclassified Novosphingobium TaxID=2644732 RepID=UPI000E4D013A|nr:MULTISPECIES: hypothetical protein [unclassified Novosphingobium]AXU19917.1 hypothetical protein C7W88_14175 [Novosphingobium sp. THN1]NLR38319.1 hypothetical protein [Novosphingobium sp. ERW19]
MNDQNDLAARAKDELSGMAKQGLAHPSTKPVLTGAAIGAVAGVLLPVVSLPLGLAVGAGVAFWQRIKR